MRSIFSLKRTLYESAPAPVRHLARKVPFGWIAGRAYRTVASQGTAIDGLTRAGVESLGLQRLDGMLRFAVANVPFYRPMRATVDRLPAVEALREFPLLDKDAVLALFDQFLVDAAIRPRHYETTTGGTSGRQLKILLPDDSQSVETAFMHRQWARVGYAPESLKATFRGVAFPRAQQGVFWQSNPVYRELQFSPMAMSEANLPEYWRRLVEFDPEFLHGYPSAISALARFVLRERLQAPGLQLKAALLGSEGCTPEQRELIARAFRTRVLSWYGHSERLILAGECEHSADYHQFPDYGYLELLDEQGQPVGVGERGEIVGTGFLNRVMPLIRYRTGDYATRLDWRCACGRAWDRFGDVEGRWKQDMVVGRSGALLSLAALNLHGPHFERVARYQYRQDTAGHCEICVVVDPGFTDADRRMIEDAYANKAGAEVTFVVRVVPEIKLTARGKFKTLVSTLSRSQTTEPDRVDAAAS